MASCDDDFSLLGDDNVHHHLSYASHRFANKASLIHAPSTVQQVMPVDDANDEDDGENFNGATFHDVPPFSGDEANDRFVDDQSDLNRSSCAIVRCEKRKERDELSDDGGTTPFSYRKAKFGSGSVAGAGTSAADYRKDREEWSDTAIACLLDAFLDKFTQLNRGNLRGRDWEEVAVVVSDSCEKHAKSVEQCKNKIDNLKKRYKLERHRMTNGGVSASHWPWFKKMELIVGNSLPLKNNLADDDKFAGAITIRQSKRSTTATSSPVAQVSIMKTNKSMSNPKWRRVVFKISGAALAGTGPNNIDPKVTMLIAREVAVACRLGVEVAIVVGGRNFFCGNTWVAATGLDGSTAYQIGMMATLMNSTLLQSAIEKMGIQTRLQSAFTMQEIAEPYSKQKAIRHLEKGRVVIFGGVGARTGNPLFSTDTAAALRASEIHAEAVLKGTNVDGVYDCNSRDNNVIFQQISFRELVSRGPTSMDLMAMNFCEENGIPVVVFNLLEPGNISRALCGDQVGTLINQSG